MGLGWWLGGYFGVPDRTHVKIQGRHNGLPVIPPWDSRDRDPQSKLDKESSHVGELWA